MEQWKKLIVSGNTHFNDDNLKQAILCYQLATTHAEKLLYSWTDPDEAVWALIASYHNLADAHQLQRRHTHCIAAIKKVNEILEAALSHYSQDHLWTSALLRGIRCTYTRLLKASPPAVQSPPTLHDCFTSHTRH